MIDPKSTRSRPTPPAPRKDAEEQQPWRVEGGRQAPDKPEGSKPRFRFPRWLLWLSLGLLLLNILVARQVPNDGGRISVPFSFFQDQVRGNNVTEVNAQGEVVQGDRPVNTAAFAIHSQVHAARPDAVAAAHSHSTYGRAFSTLGKPLAPITQDVCAFYDDHAVFDDYTGVVLDTEEGKRIAHALGDKKLVILRNHGHLSVGRTVDEAAWWFITFERSCEAEFKAWSAGEPIHIPDEMARRTRSQMGEAMAGRHNAQPLFDWIIDEQPDLLD